MITSLAKAVPCIIIHIRYSHPFLLIAGHCVPVACFCLSICNLYVLNRNFNMIESDKIFVVELGGEP